MRILLFPTMLVVFYPPFKLSHAERGSDGGWHMKAKNEEIVRDILFYCFVDFGRSAADMPRCWIIPSVIVATVLKETHQAWLDMPGLNGRPHQPTEMRRLLPDFSRRGCPKYPLGWMTKYLGAWESIARKPTEFSE